MQIVNRKSEIVNAGWLPDMDLNHDKQIQSLLCYRYTIGQGGAVSRINLSGDQSSCQTAVPEGQETVAHGFNRGLSIEFVSSPGGTKENPMLRALSPLRGLVQFASVDPRFQPWAAFSPASSVLLHLSRHVSRN